MYIYFIDFTPVKISVKKYAEYITANQKIK